jgi:hypothetical protein
MRCSFCLQPPRLHRFAAAAGCGKLDAAVLFRRVSLAVAAAAVVVVCRERERIPNAGMIDNAKVLP